MLAVAKCEAKKPVACNSGRGTRLAHRVEVAWLELLKRFQGPEAQCFARGFACLSLRRCDAVLLGLCLSNKAHMTKVAWAMWGPYCQS